MRDHAMWAVPCALGAAAAFGAANVAQMRAARRTPARDGIDVTLLGRLARDRLWVAGLVGSFVGYALQAVALYLAPVVLVQPLIVAELFFALPLAAALAGAQLGKREWAGAGFVAIGLAVFMLSVHASGTRTYLPSSTWAWMTIAMAITVGAVVLAANATPARPMFSASILAAGAGLCFGLLSVDTKAVGHEFTDHPLTALLHPQPWLLALAALAGLLLQQTAFRIAPLSVSMPIIDIGEPLAACLLAILAFHEQVGTSPAVLAGVATAVGCAVIGVALLDTSPLVREAHSRLEAATRLDGAVVEGARGTSAPTPSP